MPYSSRLANVLLFNPFDNNSAVMSSVASRMTINTFFDECYTMPIFAEKKDYAIDKDELPSKSGEISYELQDLYTMIGQQSNEYRYFSQWLNNFGSYLNENEVYTLCGNAGTGKTTFVNHLCYERPDIDWIILDFTHASSFIHWIGDERTRISHFSYAYGKILSTITEEIRSRLFRALDEQGRLSVKSVHGNLVAITNNYQRYFSDSLMSSCKFIEQICNLMNDEADQKDAILKVAHYCANYFSELSDVSPEAEMDISGVLEILLYVLRCSEAGFSKNYVIVFDNLERFLHQDEVFNDDINDFRNNLTSFSRAINQPFSSHIGHFKFIMVVRKTTARMIHVILQSADVNANILNIDEWFNTSDIIKKRFDWISEIRNHDILREAKRWDSKDSFSFEESYALLQQILNDYRVVPNNQITGLKTEIDPLFNNNKRLIVDFFGNMIEMPSNREYLFKYKSFWEQDTSLSRFAARSIVRGMILDCLEKQDNLFMHMLTYQPSPLRVGVGDARKILTILYNSYDEYGGQGMPLPKVLSELYKTDSADSVWNNDGSEFRKKRREIASTLFYMNSYNRRDNNWIQLIDIRITREQKTTLSISNPEELEMLISERMDKIELFLMPAGMAYLSYVVPSFEFFSLRYSNQYAPLFTLVPTTADMAGLLRNGGSITELPCYGIINSTVDFAMQSLDILRFEDDIPLKIKDNWVYQSTRIRNNHLGYLDSFSRFIRASIFHDNDVSSLTEESKRIQNFYTDLLDEIEGFKQRYLSSR